MKKARNILWVLGLMLMCLSCYDDTELLNRIDALEKAQTSTVNKVDEQVKAMQASISSLTTLHNGLKDQLAALEKQYEALQASGAEQDMRLSEMERDITNLTNMVQQIAVMIEDLRYAVNDLLANQKSWTEATFATLEQRNALCDVLAATKVKLEKMMQNYDAYNKANFNVLAEQILSVETSLKAWISDQLANYYDIATMDAKLNELLALLLEEDKIALTEYDRLSDRLAALEQAVAEGDEQALEEYDGLTAKLKTLEYGINVENEARKTELAELAALLDAMKTELTAAYQSAIQSAIEENNGTITRADFDYVLQLVDNMHRELQAVEPRLMEMQYQIWALMTKFEEELDIIFSETGSIVYTPGATVKVGYTLVNGSDYYTTATVEAIVDVGWKAKVVSTGKDEGYIEVTASVEGGEGKVLVFVNKGNNTIMRALRFVQLMDNGHEFVDLGLSVKWATCNVGAENPEDYGDYYAWGETEPQSDNSYSWESYKWCNGSYDNLTKYCASSSYGTMDRNTVLDAEDDVAHVQWGGNWRMPTRGEQDELRNECAWTWTKLNGVYGYKVSSKQPGNSNYIFLPAAGYRSGGNLNFVGSSGYYWSSSLYTSNSDYAYTVILSSSSVYWYNFNRFYGLSVRPVCAE